MASWGLGFEYGKKAYEEMRRTQEENDRYLAEHNLWETELRTKEAVAAANEASAKRTSAMSIALDKNTNAILSGDPQAYVNVLNAADPSVQFKHLGDGTIAQVDPKNPSMVLKGSTFSIKGKNPTSLVSELYKFAETNASISAQHREGVQDDKDKKFELEKIILQDQNSEKVARIGANATIQAAELNAASKGLTGLYGSSGSSGGKSSRIDVSKEDAEFLDAATVRVLFGEGATGIREADGTWVVMDSKRNPIALSQEDVRDLNDVHTALYNTAHNSATSNNADFKVNVNNAAAGLSGIVSNIKTHNANVKAHNDAKAQAKKASERAAFLKPKVEENNRIWADYSWEEMPEHVKDMEREYDRAVVSSTPVAFNDVFGLGENEVTTGQGLSFFFNKANTKK